MQKVSNSKFLLNLIFVSLITISCTTDTPNTYSINITSTPSEGGEVIITPEGSIHDEGTEISLHAKVSDGYSFTGWTGDFETLTNPLTFSLNQDVEINANYLIKSYLLNITIEGLGNITEEVIAAKATDYDFGTKVRLTATADRGWSFKGWSGDISSADNPLEIEMTNQTNLEATFEILTISIKTEVIRTFAGESIEYESEISNSNGTKLYQKWDVEPAHIAEIDSLGKATILDIGKADVIAKLYDENQNLIASDTVKLYSEAKKTLQVAGIIVDFTRSNLENGILVSSSGSGNMYKSTNFGEIWSPVENPQSSTEIRNIARNKIDQNYIISTYRGINSCCSAENYTGVLLSKDNGATWSEITHPYTNKSGEIFYSFSDIEFAPDDVGTLYILTQVNSDIGDIRLYKSSNLGQSWQILKTFERGSPESPSLFIDNEHNIYVGIAGQVRNGGGYVSLDKGETWGTWANIETERLLHVDQYGKLFGRNFAGNSTYTNQQIVFSDDKSQTWNVLIEDESYNLVHIDTFESDYLALLMLNNSNRLNKIKISQDGGDDWQEYILSLNASGTLNRPDKIKILDVVDGTMELLCFWGNSSYGDSEHGEIWKLKIFLDL